MRCVGENALNDVAALVYCILRAIIVIHYYCVIYFYSNPVKGSFWYFGTLVQSISMCVCLFLLFVDEFEASAMPKAKETDAQSEPEDGEEDSREEGKFLKYSSCFKITDCNAETLEVCRYTVDLNITP